MDTTALRVQNLTKRFGGVQAVREVDFDLPHGQRRALLGPNGAGKTTLFNLITGDIKPTTGSIQVFGSEVAGTATRNRVRLGLGRTYQKSLLFDGLTVLENLELAILGATSQRHRLVHKEVEHRHLKLTAQNLADSIGLNKRAGTCAGKLSHGEQRQLEIGMALAGKPRLLLLDEPAAGLSAAERATLTEMLLELPTDLTFLLIEHDMDIALTVADQVTVMQDGRIVVEGTPHEIRSSSVVHEIYLGVSHG